MLMWVAGSRPAPETASMDALLELQRKMMGWVGLLLRDWGVI